MSLGAGGGGVFAGIGHISVLGIADANTIKVLNQILELASRLVSVPLYHAQKRLVGSVAAVFGAGAMIGAIAGSWISSNYLDDMTSYRTWFGVLVAAVALRVLYEGMRKAAIANAVPSAGEGPRTVEWGWRRCRVLFGGKTFDFKPAAAALGGFVISFAGSMVGVGGGFLVTPFMASVLLFPMYLVLGTGLVALMLPLTVSVATYLALQVEMNWGLVAVEVPGVLAGSFLGPMINRRMNERVLKILVGTVLLAIGVYYVLLPK